ncbi:ATP-binding protein [Macromonas bipunctata]|uniref:ATP-binding protein n=1 Tax=Macromonas bipunctata TaxID=183670 RepID=UPI000C32F90E|nr:ATP-binding protein [Macromonas bipunctata]
MTWKFYGRDIELDTMRKLLSRQRWFFCAISGRRRIGKTSLIREALQSLPQVSKAVYLQVPDSDERDVVAVFADALKAAAPLGLPEEVQPHNLRRFSDMAKAIGALCRAGWVVILDEFQYFNRKSLSAFTSLLQAEVDQLTGSIHGGIFVLGSIHTEMTALLEDRGSPLYARVTDRMALDHWDFRTLFQVFDDQGVVAPQDWLSLWGLFEGVPKFYRDCANQGVFTDYDTAAGGAAMGMRAVEALFFSTSAPLAEEAGTWFMRELRGASVSILRLLAQQQPCAHQQLSEAYQQSTGDEKPIANYLNTLIDRYRLIERQQPVFAQKPNSRQARYQISDNFLAAWLAAVEPGFQAARVQPMSRALEITSFKLATHEGYVFERMVRKLMAEASRRAVGDFALTEMVTGYWNRPRDAARLIEIDIVAMNETERIVRFGSCKRSESKHDRNSLAKTEQHIQDFLATSSGKRFKGWKQEKALYAPHFTTANRQALEQQGWVCVDLNDYRTWLCA